MTETRTTATTTTAGALDGPAILANARAIAPLLRAEAEGNERRRRLSQRTVNALRTAGVFRISTPRAWGGPEVDPWTQVEVVEAVAQADGSAGWCVMIGASGGYFASHLAERAARTLYRSLDAVTAGVPLPGGKLEPVEGGYLLTGRWPFVSGCTHADVVIVGGVVPPAGSPAPGEPPAIRVAALPADQVTIIENWDTTGLLGTGSHDVSADDVFVPADHTFTWDETTRDEPLYAWTGMFLVNHLGVPLGIARAALDAAADILLDKIIAPEMRPARDEPRVRVAVARAHALVGSARSYAFDVVADFWATLTRGERPSRRQRAALAGAYVHTARVCREAAELLADAVGTSAVFRRCALERHRRDLATACAHLTAQDRFLELVGGLWIEGADLDHPLAAGGMI